MNNKIKSVNIYYADLDKLILECVTPEMTKRASNLDLWFWERGCIGGRHLKVRWIEKEDSTDIKTSLFRNVNKFLKANPSPDSAEKYNSAAGRKLARTERREISESQFTYKIDKIRSYPYERKFDIDSSEEAVEILHQFLHDSRGLCTEFLSSKLNKTSLVMSLMLIFALEQFDNIEEGCIGFRAHWDNYEHWFKPPALAQRIKQHYESNKPAIQKVVKNILELHERNEIETDAKFAAWISILRKNRMMVYKHQLAGVKLISQPINQEDVINTNSMLENDGLEGRSKHFLERLYKQPEYLGRLGEIQGLQMTRITINLIYHMFSNLGISFFERMSCSYFVHRSVEDLLKIDLADVLDTHMKKVIGDKFISTI